MDQAAQFLKGGLNAKSAVNTPDTDYGSASYE
jgi:hypothetical protein